MRFSRQVDSLLALLDEGLVVHTALSFMCFPQGPLRTGIARELEEVLPASFEPAWYFLCFMLEHSEGEVWFAEGPGYIFYLDAIAQDDFECWLWHSQERYDGRDLTLGRLSGVRSSTMH